MCNDTVNARADQADAISANAEQSSVLGSGAGVNLNQSQPQREQTVDESMRAKAKAAWSNRRGHMVSDSVERITNGNVRDMTIEQVEETVAVLRKMGLEQATELSDVRISRHEQNAEYHRMIADSAMQQAELMRRQMRIQELEQRLHSAGIKSY